MNYGYFDEKAREYVITNPNTPGPWANYLGSPEYGAIVTVNAGGYSFVKSGAAGRILRYIFNQFDEPGRYIYLRDEETGDFWSASWKPVAKPLDEYKTECRHGTSYTEIVSEYNGIRSKALYYVPMGATHEVWRISLENLTDRPRKISVFGYAELTTDSFYTQDLVNMQYTQFITRTEFHDNFLLEQINEFNYPNPDGTTGRERFFGLAGAPVASYTGRREQFLGRNRFDKPQAVLDGKCDDSLNYNANPCGALQFSVELKPGERKTAAFLLGQKTVFEAKKIMDRYADTEATVEKELQELIRYWHGELENLKICTPDKNFDAMVNTWNAFQCFTTFVWSRAASLIYCGERNGYGYRDTVQDIQGIMHLDPELARKQLTFMLSAQVHHGAGLPLVKYSHNAGHEDTPEQDSYVKETGHPSYRADDALWLFPTVYKYVAETGNTVLDHSAASDEAWKTSVLHDFAAGNEPDVLFFFAAGADSAPILYKVVPIADINAAYPEADLPENEALRDLFNNALADMEKDGTLANLLQESVTPAIFDAEVHPVPASIEPAEGAETIRVAVTGSLPPMDYFAGDGTPAGFNTGIMAEIGRRTGKNIEFVSVVAGARLLALSSGSVDVVFWARNHAEHDTLVDTEAWKALLRDHPDLENSLTEEEEARIRSARDAIFAIRAGENEQPEGTILSRPFYSDWYAYLIRRE